ncbi:MAG: single-stranded DNA-binding protein [Actinomyces urogenitalis]|uniref:single-stranded DNA-binding protein n=1 Tax=Actinomyces urogenitalis TaxID=103621 RepID=UPI002A7F2E8B|nr:single-stranded DNA-binding protein [Actinomyces urogenitalis]MDY3678407.1 single-stranded DNA-binding protein [Actinomyces urogenitalis]
MNRLTITGYLGADPELSYVAATGKPVVNVRVADTPRSLNRETGQWEDGTTLWLRASAWGPMAEHIANSVRKGDLVTLTGRLTQHNYVNRNGEQRHRIELSIEDFAVSLSRTSVSVQRESRRGSADGSVASNSAVTGNSGIAGHGGITGSGGNSGNGAIASNGSMTSYASDDSIAGHNGISGNEGNSAIASNSSVTGNSGIAGHSADGGVTGGWSGGGEEDPWGPVAVPGGGA